MGQIAIDIKRVNGPGETRGRGKVYFFLFKKEITEKKKRKKETIYKKRLEAPRHFYLAQSHALAEPFVLIIAFFSLTFPSS